MRPVLRAAGRPQAPGQVLDAAYIPDEQTAMAEQELLMAERNAAQREAFTHLPPRCQQLITTLIEDPPVPYAKISARLGIPVEKIAPSRGRCLATLRPRSGNHRPDQRRSRDREKGHVQAMVQ